MRRRRCWPWLALLLLAALPALAEQSATQQRRPPGIAGEDDRRPMPSNDWPWAAIGRLNRGSSYCTGTLVAADAVLTAAHCLHDLRRGADVKAHELHFLAGYRKGEYLAHGIGRSIDVAAKAAPAAGLPKERRATLADVATDWAIVRLRQPLPVRPIPLASATTAVPALEKSLLRAGYGQDRPHLLSVHDGCRVLQRFADVPVLLTDCDATRGDSGSPLLHRHGEQVFLVGLISAVFSDGAQSGSLAVATPAFAGRLAERR